MIGEIPLPDPPRQRFDLSLLGVPRGSSRLLEAAPSLGLSEAVPEVEEVIHGRSVNGDDFLGMTARHDTAAEFRHSPGQSWCPTTSRRMTT